ncbi:hypothetical protein QFZ51_003488 [Chitinophaga sp. W3I9]
MLLQFVTQKCGDLFSENRCNSAHFDQIRYKKAPCNMCMEPLNVIIVTLLFRRERKSHGVVLKMSLV